MPAKPSKTHQPRPVAAERRGYVRYKRTLDTFWQFLGLPPRDLTAGQVVDLSASGVGLMLDRTSPEGTSLVLRLPTARSGWASHLVRVKHCRPAAGGRYVVGCQFVRPLTPEQLIAHLE